MTFLAELKRTSPCRVQERAFIPSMGQYWWKRSIKHGIELQTDLTEVGKEAVLVHELGHQRCDAKNCQCMESVNDHVEAEIHAELYALHFLLKHRRIRALAFRIDLHIFGWNTLPYAEALQVIKTRKIYKRCEKAIEIFKVSS